MEGLNQNRARNTSQNAYESTRDRASNTSFRDSEFLEEGKKRINDMNNNIEEYADDVMSYVRSNPFTSLLVASGIGFIISKFISK